MPLPLWKTAEPDFRRRFEKLRFALSLEEGLRKAGERQAETPVQAVRRIVEDVRNRGDAALLEQTERLDNCRLSADQLRVSEDEIKDAVERCPADLLASLRLAAERVRVFQASIRIPDPEPLEFEGRHLGVRYRPVDSAGVYVPGGGASLASTVIMSAVPARVAGVERVVMVTPPRADGSITNDRLAAASIAEVDEVYRVGGAQAIAALAYGTESIEPVDFIAGPGNIYVTLAKKEVFGTVGIEMLPGPSEVVVIADGSANPVHVAADLLSQAEHNPGSAVLLTDAEALARSVRDELERQLPELPNMDATRSCLQAYSALVVCEDIAECVDLANELAPEHLEVLTGEPEAVAKRIRHAGAIFLGAWTPEPVGDYVAGPSHVLPTSGTARFSSGLSCNDFLKRSSILRYSERALRQDAAAIMRMARAERLEAHARSVAARTEGPDQP